MIVGLPLVIANQQFIYATCLYIPRNLQDTTVRILKAFRQQNKQKSHQPGSTLSASIKFPNDF